MTQRISVSWGASTPADFVAGVVAMAQAFHWPTTHPGYLMGCMAFESGGTFSPDVRNAAGSGAVGLIQFMPATAAGLGTTTENLALLSATEQLFYVQKYFEPYSSRIWSLEDMYMAILLPKAIGLPNASVLFTEGTVAYRQNAGLDTDTDGKVTKGEAAQRVRDAYNRGMQAGHVGFADWGS